MKILLDTNILIRLGHAGQAQHTEARAATDELDVRGYECVLVPQVLYEYWAVATRPAEVNGLGMDVASADQAIMKWVSVYDLLLDERGIFRHWRTLVTAYLVKGKNAHDARLVAAMQRHGLTHLLTFNQPDFMRFTGIQAVTPADVLAGNLSV